MGESDNIDRLSEESITDRIIVLTMMVNHGVGDHVGHILPKAHKTLKIANVMTLSSLALNFEVKTN